MRTKRRALVLTDEAARHPFRRSLPPPANKFGATKQRRFWQICGSDLRDFFATYCAVFLAVTTYIA